MSENYYKVALRFPLAKYHGWGLECVLNDLESKLSHLTRPPIEFEDDPVEQTEWYYGYGRLKLVWDIECCVYGFDYIFCDGAETDERWGACVPMYGINPSVISLCKQFDIHSSSVYLHAYRWYSGGDEPINFAD